MCVSNSKLICYIVDDITHVSFVAEKNIEVGDEITFDYNLTTCFTKQKNAGQ